MTKTSRITTKITAVLSMLLPFGLSAGEDAGRLVRPLAYGLTAALVGTLVANAFYLTIQFYYFFVLALFIVAAPLVFARRRQCAL